MFKLSNTGLKTNKSNLRNLDLNYLSFSPLLTWSWCYSVFSHPLTMAATFWLAFSLSPPSYLSRRQLNCWMRTSTNGWHVWTFMLMLGCQHTSVWSDMTQQTLPPDIMEDLTANRQSSQRADDIHWALLFSPYWSTYQPHCHLCVHSQFVFV
jgi:hypothetical protein